MDSAVTTMQAWTADASGVHIGSLRESPYARDNVRAFLAADLGDPAKILVAPKGYGKTLFLKLKAHALRRRVDAGIPIFPDSSSDIEFLKLSMEWRELNQIARPLTVDNWSLLWQFVLIAKGAQLIASDDIKDEQLKSVIGDQKLPIGDMLAGVRRGQHERALSIMQKLPTVRNALNNSGKSCAIFIDNADEMFVASSQESASLDRDSGWGALSEPATSRGRPGNVLRQDSAAPAEGRSPDNSIWSDAQVGLMLAVREIERSTRKLNVYTSLRAEAVVSANHPLALQAAQTYTVRLQYSKAELRRIFEWHVNLMRRENLASPDADDAVERLVGKVPIRHSYVKVNGVIVEEELVDLLARHTCYSPRELVVLGGAVASLSVEERLGPQRSSLIRSKVSELATSLYFAFRRNFVPRWPLDIDAALGRIQSAVLSQKAVNELGLAAQTLYVYGLLGYSVATDIPNEFRQEFLNHWDARFGSRTVALPNASYYFIHPWLFDFCVAKNKRFRRSPQNIIGDGCIFVPPAPAVIWLSRDERAHPLLTIDGDVCWPTTKTQRMTMPAAFMMTLALAITREGSTYITEQAFKSAHQRLRNAYPELGGIQVLDPFTRPEHRAHLDKSIDSTFPWLRARFAHLPSLFEFHGTKKTEKALVALFTAPGSVNLDAHEL